MWGGLSPPLLLQGGSGGAETINGAPLGVGLGATPLKLFFFFKCLVKYCNFVVNLDRSLCHIFDSRSYANVGSFAIEGNPLLYMRELYYGCVLL